MKNYITFILSFFIIINAFAQKITFPGSFKFDPSIFKGMKLTKINEELRKAHIFENPAVITDQLGIKIMAERMDAKNITKVYYEIYSDLKGNGDAGFYVYEFNSVNNMEKVLPDLQDQSNYVVLTADRYLIQVWNDSRDTENRLRKAVDYYKRKVNAKKIELKAFENNGADSTDVVTVAASEVIDAAAEVAPYGGFYNIGFGSFSADLISPDQNRKLQNYARKFKDNYRTEIALASIGNSDLTEEMIPGYASHLVFNDDDRINNNIVILIDEVKNKSYFYLGKQNGKVLSKLPLEKLKKDLNLALENGNIFEGLNSVLEKFETALGK